jgi:hypothetical protein
VTNISGGKRKLNWAKNRPITRASPGRPLNFCYLFHSQPGMNIGLTPVLALHLTNYHNFSRISPIAIWGTFSSLRIRYPVYKASVRSDQNDERDESNNRDPVHNCLHRESQMAHSINRVVATTDDMSTVTKGLMRQKRHMSIIS